MQDWQPRALLPHQHSQSLFKSDFTVALHMFVSVTLLTSRGPLLAIFSASSLLRLRSFDKSPTTGSNCNYKNKEFKKIYSDNDSHLPTFSQSRLRHFSKAKQDESFKSFSQSWLWHFSGESQVRWIPFRSTHMNGDVITASLCDMAHKFNWSTPQGPKKPDDCVSIANFLTVGETKVKLQDQIICRMTLWVSPHKKNANESDCSGSVLP